MAKRIHNGIKYGRVRYNFKATNVTKARYPKKLIFTPEKSVKGTCYYFDSFTILLSEVHKLPDFGKIIDERLLEEKQKASGHTV